MNFSLYFLVKKNNKSSDFGYKIDNIYDLSVGYQILGLLILQTGSIMPEIIYSMIEFSTRWPFDENRLWDNNFIPKRKEYLKEFRQKILDYKYNRI